jgi:hypothetical protein
MKRQMPGQKHKNTETGWDSFLDTTDDLSGMPGFMLNRRSDCCHQSSHVSIATGPGEQRRHSAFPGSNPDSTTGLLPGPTQGLNLSRLQEIK